MASSKLTDSFNRTPKKLRISVTDRCNMRCIYCMPQKEFSWRPRDEILSYEEITRLANIFVSLGIEKIRITGGEPLVRPQIENLVSTLSKIDGLKKIGLTTNGDCLARADFVCLGVSCVASAHHFKRYRL